VKHRLALSATLVAGALSLAACAPDPIVDPSAGSQSQPTVSADPGLGIAASPVDEALAAMTWDDNGAETAPTIGFTFPINFDQPGTRVIADGDGEQLRDGQTLSLHYVAISGVDGSPVFATYDAKSPEPVLLSTDSFEPSLYKVLTSAHVGSRILYAVPDSGGGSVVMALTVVATTDVPERAEGTAAQTVAGDPVVTLDGSGKPSIDFAGATKPTELVSHDLIVGDGATVHDNQTVTVHYTGWLWDGDTFDSSWERGQAFTTVLAKGNLIDGWIDGLVGKTVGSQVLLVVPPSAGYGDRDQGSIPAGSTLVFVVDILAAY